MKQKLSNLWGKDGTKSVLASLISILIGMVVGALIIIIVGAANPSLGLNSAWEGIRLVFGGLFTYYVGYVSPTPKSATSGPITSWATWELVYN